MEECYWYDTVVTFPDGATIRLDNLADWIVVWSDAAREGTADAIGGSQFGHELYARLHRADG